MSQGQHRDGGAAILVADDDFAMRHVLEECLLDAGHFPVVVHRGDEVLERLEHVMPDALVLDHALPGVSGLELVRAVRGQAHLQDLPVIMLTAHDDTAVRLGALEAGADDILTKPFEPLELQTRLRNLLRLKNLRRALEERNFTLEEEVARRSAQLSRQSALLQALSDAIIFADPELRILTWNAGAEVIYGHPREEAVGARLWDVLPRDFGREDPEQVEQALRRGGRWAGELQQTTADGREIWVQASFTTLQDHRGRTAGYAVVAHDLTELHLARSQLAEAEARGHEARKMEALGRLIRGIAHDFNNYLAVITSSAALGQEEVEAGRAPAEDLAMVLDAAQRAGDLTKQLLAFSKRQSMAPVRTELNGVIARLRQMFGRVIGPGVQVDLRLAQELPDVVVDVVALEQVLMNLVVNARDAMPNGGTLTVDTAVAALTEAEARAQGLAPGAYVRLRVEDTGVGMDEDTRSRVFEPFFSTKGPDKGTGLDLATVYKLVQESGGQISVRSEPGVGTAFEILLPGFEEAAESDLARLDEAPVHLSLAGRRVIVAEDEPALLTMIQRVLGPTGVTVVATASGREAVAALEMARPDALITAVRMPEMSGWALARRAHATWPELPVLFVTGDGVDVDDHGEPMQHILRKPFLPRDLLTVLQRVVAPHSARK
ncbi:MAG: response regulator [Myxococcales bacterium]|nr:response regulator [Myxococcales bacterium]